MNTDMYTTPTHTQNTSISCIHYWRHHACRHRCTLNVHVLLILKGFPDFDETFVCVVSIWNSRTLGATGKSPRCFLTIPPTPQRDGNHSQRLLPRISSIFKLQTHAHVLVRITVLRYLKVNNSLQADDTIHAPSNSTTAAGGCFYKNLSQRSCFRHVLFFKSWAMICVQVWRWRCLNLCLTAMDDLQWFVPPGYRTVHISERLWTVLFRYIVVVLHVFERCMMYDTIFQARIRQFLSGDPHSNQHHVVSQLPDVTTGVAWTLFTVWTRVLPPFSPPVGWWIHFSEWLKVVDKYVEESDFMYKITHMYIIYKWFIVKIQHVIDVHIIGSLYQLIQLVFFSFSWLQLERHFSGRKARRALRIEICRVLWGKDRHEFVDVYICFYMCFVQFKINQG